MSLQKAVIAIDPRDRGDKLPDRITVQFNPSEYSLSKGAQIAEINIPGIDSPILQFVRGQNEKLTLELFFDTTGDGMGEDGVTDVRTLTDPVYQLVKIQGATHAPPRICFSWGQGLSFRAIVESIQQKFTVFNPHGIPLRASLAVTFREYKTLEEQLNELNLQSSDHSKQYVVRRNDTLSRIAFDQYGDSSRWRVIADDPANAGLFASPRQLQPGTCLTIPALDVFGNPTGDS
jgi:Contractile injection system tube protein